MAQTTPGASFGMMERVDHNDDKPKKLKLSYVGRELEREPARSHCIKMQTRMN